MKELDLIVRLLAAVSAAEERDAFDPAFVDERVLKAPPAARDRAAIKAVKAGYLDGLHIIENVDGQRAPHIAWERSNPYVTIAGLEYLSTNAAARQIIQELKDAAVSLAAQAVGAAIPYKL